MDVFLCQETRNPPPDRVTHLWAAALGAKAGPRLIRKKSWSLATRRAHNARNVSRDE
jgi:hypothetical protein